MLFQVGSLEMLLSDSVLAAQKAKEAGCDVTLTVYQDMFHVFQLSMDKLAESRAAWMRWQHSLVNDDRNI